MCVLLFLSCLVSRALCTIFDAGCKQKVLDAQLNFQIRPSLLLVSRPNMMQTECQRFRSRVESYNYLISINCFIFSGPLHRPNPDRVEGSFRNRRKSFSAPREASLEALPSHLSYYRLGRRVWRDAASKNSSPAGPGRKPGGTFGAGQPRTRAQFRSRSVHVSKSSHLFTNWATHRSEQSRS
jgi:hypothetical protein